MKFFFDNCVSPRYAHALTAVTEVGTYPILHLRDKFPTDTPDVDWLRELARERDWIIISADTRISKKRSEKHAWIETGLTTFFLGQGWSKKKFWTQFEILVHVWPEIVARAQVSPSGTGYLVPPKGRRFKVLYEPDA